MSLINFINCYNFIFNVYHLCFIRSLKYILMNYCNNCIAYVWNDMLIWSDGKFDKLLCPDNVMPQTKIHEFISFLVCIYTPVQAVPNPYRDSPTIQSVPATAKVALWRESYSSTTADIRCESSLSDWGYISRDLVSCSEWYHVISEVVLRP